MQMWRGNRMIIAFLSPFNIPKFVIKIKLRQKIESKQSRNILENICKFELGYSSSLPQLFNHSNDIIAVSPVSMDYILILSFDWLIYKILIVLKPCSIWMYLVLVVYYDTFTLSHDMLYSIFCCYQCFLAAFSLLCLVTINTYNELVVLIVTNLLPF